MRFPNRAISAILLLAVTASMLLSCYFSEGSNRAVAKDETEAGSLFFSQYLVDTGKLTWYSEYNEKYEVSFFAPRYMVDLDDYDYASQYSLAYVVALSMGQMNSQFINLQILLCIFSALGILAVFLVVREVFDQESALIAAILVSILPPYVAFSNIYHDILPSLVIYILSMYCFFKFINSQKVAYLGLAAVFFVFAAFLRDVNAPVYIAGYLPLVIGFWNHLFTLRSFLTGFIFLGSTFLLFSLVNWMVYGGFLTTGRTLAESGTAEVRGTYVPFKMNILSEVSYHHIVDFLPVLLLGILGMVAAQRFSSPVERRRRAVFLISTLLTVLATLVVFGSRPNVFGFGTGWLFSSPTRYFLPIYIALSIYLAIFLRHLLDQTQFIYRMATIILIITIVVSFCITSFGDSDGSLPNKKREVYKCWNKSHVIDTLPLEAVIIAQKADKYAFPSKEVIIISNRMVTGEASSRKTGMDTVRVVDDLLEDGKPVYIVDNTIAILYKALMDANTKPYRLTQTKRDWLYRVR